MAKKRDNPQYPVLVGEFSCGLGSFQVFKTSYVNNGNLAIIVQDEDGAPYATLSENHEGAEMKSSEFAVQERNLSGEFLLACLNSGLFEDTGNDLTFGPFGTTNPVWRLKEKLRCHSTM